MLLVWSQSQAKKKTSQGTVVCKVQKIVHLVWPLACRCVQGLSNARSLLSLPLFLLAAIPLDAAFASFHAAPGP